MVAKLVENTIPVLPVQELERSIEFYRSNLGFDLDWKTSDVCAVVRDGCSIMLQRCSDGSRGTVWIGLEDDSLFAALVAAGVVVIQAPTKRPWAYEMKVADPDGNTLWLGTDPVAG